MDEETRDKAVVGTACVLIALWVWAGVSVILIQGGWI